MIQSLVRVTAWERVSFARRFLCAFGRVSVWMAALAVIGYSIFAYRYVIEAKVWHWKHGYSTTLGGYEIPVPDHWVILNHDSKFFTMANTSPTQRRGDGKFHTTAVVTADVNRPVVRRDSEEARWMDTWVSFERQHLTDRKVEGITEKALKLGGESITCLGGKELKAALKDRANVPQMEAVSLTCRSDRGLNLMFVGDSSDVEAFYALISQIRRTD